MAHRAALALFFISWAGKTRRHRGSYIAPSAAPLSVVEQKLRDQHASRLLRDLARHEVGKAHRFAVRESGNLPLEIVQFIEDCLVVVV
jgi:hypothetical protein